MNLERRVCYDFRMVGPRVLLPEVTQNYDSGVSLEALNIKGPTVYFSSHCGQILDKKQLKGERV